MFPPLKSLEKQLPRCARSSLSLLVAAVLWLGLYSSASAAGCGYHRDEAASGLPKGIAKIYEGGQFRYYQTIPPCSGPSCKKSDSSSLTTPMAAVTSESSSLIFIQPSAELYVRNHSSRLWSDLRVHYRSPFEGEPLKPPV